MRKTTTLMFFVALLVSACTSQPSPTPTPAAPKAETATVEPPTAEPTTAPPTTEPISEPTDIAPPSVEPATALPAVAVPTPADHPGLPLPTDRGELFTASGLCAVCHTNMADASGSDVSIDSFWRSTMMANSSRDPYWQASFTVEVLENPDYQEVIEDKCTTCHTPMARFTAYAEGDTGKASDDGFLSPANELHTLAMDSVSCTLCHQIRADHFGQPESYSGFFVIDTELPTGERVTFGPFPVDETQAIIMQGTSGFIPEQSSHVQQSELCGTCHTLYTPYLGATGQIAGEFPEQTPYLEWLHSDFRDTHSCQSCHMPEAQGGVVLSTTGGEPRNPFHKHVFVGGNAYVLTLLQQYADELGATASSAQFGDTIERVRDQMQDRTATIALEDVRISDSRLTANVVIENQVGHKFPTAYPSRRAWLHFTVRDANDQVVFESGALKADGSIAHNDNDTDPTSYEPHYSAINSPDQVQIYEAIMENSEGEVTTTLLRGAAYVKDNRLPPLGFDPVDDDIAVRGRAVEDGDFGEGGDQIQYDVPLDDAAGPFTVTVELLYQPISYRWADNLRRHQSPEITRFLDYQQDVPNLPLIIASTTAEVGD